MEAIDPLTSIFSEEIDPLDVPDLPETPSDLGAPAVRARPALVEQFVAVIRSGPASGSGGDYSDARYYLDRAAPNYNSKDDDLLSAQTEKIKGIAGVITATNLAELSGGTHLLAPGTVVQVFSLPARPGGTLHVFNHQVTQAVIVQITGSATGFGEYDGQILAGVASTSPSSNLGMPAGMSAGDSVLILNSEEDGQTGHRLVSGAYSVGVVRGMTGEQPPRKLVVIRGALGRTDSPKSVPGGGVTPDSTTWSRAGDGTPLSLTVVTSVAWDSTNAKLVANSRTLLFDARGALSSVTAESQAAVDTATSC